MNEAFKPYNFLLSAAVGAGKQTIDGAYEINEIHKYLDFVNLMTYVILLKLLLIIFIYFSKFERIFMDVGNHLPVWIHHYIIEVMK